MRFLCHWSKPINQCQHDNWVLFRQLQFLTHVQKIYSYLDFRYIRGFKWWNIFCLGKVFFFANLVTHSCEVLENKCNPFNFICDLNLVTYIRFIKILFLMRHNVCICVGILFEKFLILVLYLLRKIILIFHISSHLLTLRRTAQSGFIL